ncbi:monovalent cation/H(+) antiporter subunit G [Roseomonas sp. 18066]|uniref:monovalent cation/H(+) antiporter subunit G n=1 Tax=Roseomonas sp. 18066 TaxID=2681412 RepID=UPI001356805F|nr:monovalent cation/H(+) antiporter subunit G [Roseomonas sp. 18066]
MSGAAELPLFVAIPVAILLVLGAGLSLAGSIGLLRLKSFYERVHAPTIGTSYGLGSVLLASMIFFSVLQTRLVVHEVLIGILVVVTTPVTLMLVTRAALHRDRLEGNPEVPPPLSRPPEQD